MLTFAVNGQEYRVDVDPDMPLLWVLRDILGFTGTKYGCGIGECGSCTVHVDGEAQQSCIVRASNIAGRQVTTIEGLSSNGPHLLQEAWIAEKVSQCGYCQAGQIMTAVALLNKNSTPTDEDISAAMARVLCRCGTYQRIRRAIHRAARG